MTETHDYRDDAEEAILQWFRNRAEARGKSPPDHVRRAFIDTSPSGVTSYYVYGAAGAGSERAYLAADSTAYREGFVVSFGLRPSYFPKIGRVTWENRK